MNEFKLHDFPGGLKLDNNKSLSLNHPIERPALPPELIIPVRQHIGNTGDILVDQGQSVSKGQCLTSYDNPMMVPVHAPTSGEIVFIGDRPIPHATGLNGRCIVIRPDGLDQWGERAQPIGDNYRDLNADDLAEQVRIAGIAGMGGATFPTAVKLTPSDTSQIDTLIVNAAECEPYITCDQQLLKERAQAVLRGAEIAKHAVGAKRCLIGVEDHMRPAIDALQQALSEKPRNAFHVVAIPSRYPTGGEKQLIKVLTGREVPAGGLPRDVGILCHNTGTLYAIHRWIDHAEPLIQRIVTVTGKGVKQPQNLEVLIGTPVATLIQHCGGYTSEVDRLLLGGPMMGFALRSDQLPLVKASNCVLAGTEKEFGKAREAQACIRCGACAEVCPAELLPQQLYWHTRAKQFEKAQEYQLNACIECGCCDYVCPSAIPLAQYFRFAKTEIKQADVERREADHARIRHEARQKRIEQQKLEREQKMAAKKAAAERAKAAKAALDNDKTVSSHPKKTGTDSNNSVEKNNKADAISEAIARAKARKAAIKQGDDSSPKSG